MPDEIECAEPPAPLADGSMSSARNGRPARVSDPDLPPGVALLVEAMRQSNADMRQDMKQALGELASEVRGLRAEAPGRVAVYALGGVLTVALIALLALVATRGVDPGAVADAARQAAPLGP